MSKPKLTPLQRAVLQSIVGASIETLAKFMEALGIKEFVEGSAEYKGSKYTLKITKEKL